MGDLRRLIVFDLDGTLVDSERDLADAVNALLTERGADALPRAAIASMVGDGAAVLVRRAFDAARLQMDATTLPRFLELYDERLLDTTRPYPGIVGALDVLERHGVLAVLTNKPLAHTRRLLEALGLASFFSDVIGGDGPFARKPDAAGLRHLMTHHETAARRTVVVGDSHIDAATARAAGAAFCLARYGFGARTLPPDVLQPSDRAADSPAAVSSAVLQLLT